MANNSGGGKFLTGFMCFFVGFIVAIAAEFAVIAGCLYWLYTSDLTTIFDTIGIENTEEDDTTGETKYIYINTTEITTVSDLIAEIRALAELGTDGLTLGDFENFPIVDSVIDTIYETIADILDVDEDYVRERIDEEKLKEQTLTEIVDFLVTGIKGFGLDVIINLVMDLEDENNSLLLSLIYGDEAATVTYDGEPYVLYYDSFTYDEASSSYIRSDGVTLDSDYEQYLFKSASDYKLYYMVATNGTAYIVTRSSGEYSFATTDTQSSANTQTVSYSLTAASAVSGDPLVEYALYSSSAATLSGAYYTIDNGDGTTTYVYLTDAKTIGDILDGGIDTLLYDLYISDLLSDQTLKDMFDGISIGDLMEDENISDTLLNNIYLSDFLGDDSDPLLAEIFDGKTIGDIINSDDVVSDLFGDLYLSELFGENADQTMVDMFEGYTVADLLNGNFSIDDISLSIMDVDPESDIMAFIVYSITDIAAQTGTITVDGETVSYTHTATLHVFDENDNDTTYDAYVATETDNEGTTISAVYYYDNGEYKEASAVTINEISAQTDRLMDVVSIGGIMDVDADSAIMAFIGYSITNVTAMPNGSITVGSVTVDYSYTATLHVFDSNDNDTTYDAYVVTDTSGVISAVYYVNDSGVLTQASGVTINEISAQTDRLMDVVPIGDIMSVDADNAIMSFIAYSITNVTEQSGSSITVGGVTVSYYTYTATLHIFSDDGNGGEIDTTYDAYVVTDSNGAITAVYYVDGTTLKKAPGVTINEISDQADRMMDVVPIGDIMSIDADSAIMAFIGYSVTNVTAETGNKTVGSTSVDYSYTATLHVFDDSGNDTTYDAYVVTNTSGAITAVYYINDSGVLTKASGVTINEISTQTDRMMEVVPIGDLVTFSSDTKLTQKISESTINGIGDVIDSLTIVDAMDGVYTTDSTVILYIAYGISGFDSTTVYDTCTIDGVTYNVYTATYHIFGVDSTEDPAYDYDDDTVYLLADSTTNEIVYMYASYDNGACETEISATSINDVTDRIDGLMEDLTIGEIAGESLDTSSKLAYKLSGYTVNTINDFIDALTLADVIEDVTVPNSTSTDSDSSTIMDYIVYGLTSVTSLNTTVNGYNLYSAVYNAYGDSTEDSAYEYDGDTVYLLVDSNLVICGIYAEKSCTTEISETLATPVNYVTARMDGLMSDLTIGELMDTSGSVFLSALSSSTINSLSTDVQNLAIQSLFYDSIYSEVEAAAANVTADNAEVDSYLRVVYESITSISGTYYYYDSSTLTATTDNTTIADNLAAGTLYWTDGTSGVIYQVVSYVIDDTDPNNVEVADYYLYLDGNGDYVGSGSGRGHIDSTTTLSTYISEYGILYTYGKPEGTWYFMLYSNGVENIYTVDDIEALTENATSNINGATLSELYDAGILTSISKTDLEKKVYVSVLTSAGIDTTAYSSVIEGSGSTAYVVLGDLYLADTISVFVSSFGN